MAVALWSNAVLALSLSAYQSRARPARMALNIKGHQSLPLTEPLKDYAEQKVGKHCSRYEELLTGTTLQMKVLPHTGSPPGAH